MSIVVDLPAPFGPSKATVSPAAMSRLIPRTAGTGPCGEAKVLVSPRREIPAEGAADDGGCRVVVMAETMPEPARRRQCGAPSAGPDKSQPGFGQLTGI